MTLLEDLRWRGMVHSLTEGLEQVLEAGTITAYVGFDPSADSLHVGSLLPIMSLARLQRRGHRPIAIAGGGTGLIGDPSGKSEERPLLTQEQVEANVQGLERQLGRFLDFAPGKNSALMVNNAEWLKGLGLIEFLRDVGKHFSVAKMYARDAVKLRLEKGYLSYTEFSYMLLQAYDFLVLHDRYGCTLQMGGSDQWGNILAGTELIRKMRGAAAHGLVFPLITTASGKKFGKTEAGTIWLDRRRTSVYDFYQFWLRTEDADVVRYLEFFTWLPRERVEALEREMAERPEGREAQQVLAEEVTGMVHGAERLAQARRISQALFGGDLASLGASDILEWAHDAPSADLAYAEILAGRRLSDLAFEVGFLPSKSEARRLIRGGGLYLNDRRIAEETYTVTPGDLIEGKLLLLRRGRTGYHIVRVGEGPARP